MTQHQRLEGELRPGTYLIDPARSSVRLTGTHTFGLKPVDATVAVRSGTVMVGTRPEQSTVSADLDPASFTTDDPKRDKDVRGKRFLAADTHPAIGFRSTGLTRTAEGWQLAGVVSIRGGSAPVTLSVVDVQPTTDGYRIRATTRIDRVAVGVTGGRALVGRHVRVTVECCVISG
jgi:polyisoprenoid-binding protein YceI